MSRNRLSDNDANGAVTRNIPLYRNLQGTHRNLREFRQSTPDATLEEFPPTDGCCTHSPAPRLNRSNPFVVPRLRAVYHLATEPSMSEPATSPNSNLTPEARSALGVVFLTLFIDLISFSIIFPLFPNMLAYYREIEGQSGLFGAVYSLLLRLTEATASPEGEWGVIVLFGGVLGALYSLLQFVFAPIIGKLSDRFGRKPILILGLSGMLLSHLLWLFAGRFWLLVLSRVVGGVMSGNISTATAVVADVTHSRARAKGMAIVGMAFGLGFIVGPAAGGITGDWDMTKLWPELAAYGINPFSTPALIASILSLINLLQLTLRFRESLSRDRRDRATVERTANPAVMLRTRALPGVGKTNLTYFLFFVAFSAMEFSLTFLTVDRFGFAPRDNGMLFLYSGVILALVQGGCVQRRAARIGPKALSVQGMVLAIPGLILIGTSALAESPALVYAGLGLLAAGVAHVTPCLTAMASLYAPAGEQGRVLGVFRSVGALARAVGPLAGCVLYWRLGATSAYISAGLFLLLPLWLAARLPALPPHPNPTKL